jgi:hypothetical protein
MKRAVLSVILALGIIIGGAKPAPAVMIDITQILGKVNEYLKKISDISNKVSQEINQIKLMSTQGFDLSQLHKMVADDFFIEKIGLKTKIRKLVSGSKKKKTAVMAQNQEYYKKGATDNYAEKKNVAYDDLQYLSVKLAEAEANLSATDAECSAKYWSYDVEEEIWEKDRKWGVYVECVTRRDLYAAQVEELRVGVQDMAAVYNDQLGKEIRARNGDKNYKEREKHKQTLENAAKQNKTVEGSDGEEAEFFTTGAGANTEWDSDGTADRYQLKSDKYFKFARRYFYDPNDPAFAGEGQGKERMVMFQSNTDRLNRERRFLFINTAAHLMQVAATSRREIAKRMKGQEKISEETGGPNEYDATAAYSATRIESIKALLLYAQVQSAKLQYLAAKELLEAELRKNNIVTDNGRFHLIDLGKYEVSGEQ